jgi:hypothetical protein
MFYEGNTDPYNHEKAKEMSSIWLLDLYHSRGLFQRLERKP